MTDVEKKLWFYLRAKKFGAVFHRQYSIGNYVVDFYCPRFKLAIELDGSQHNDVQNKLDDQYRSTTLEQHGVKVLRFWNDQIIHNIKDVLEVIWNEVHPFQDRTPPYRPSSNLEEGKREKYKRPLQT